MPPLEMTNAGAMRDLFGDVPPPERATVPIGPRAVILRQFVGAADATILRDLNAVVAQAPFRHMVTPGGLKMSVAMSNCGELGWVSDRTGYRYDLLDPLSGQARPAMPDSFLDLAVGAAVAAGHEGFGPRPA